MRGYAEISMRGVRAEGMVGVPVDDGDDDKAGCVVDEGPRISHDGGYDVRGRDDVQWACATRRQLRRRREL